MKIKNPFNLFVAGICLSAAMMSPNPLAVILNMAMFLLNLYFVLDFSK